MSAEKRARELLAVLTKIRDSTFRDAASLRGIADLAINSDRAGDYALTPQWQEIWIKNGLKELISMWRSRQKQYDDEQCAESRKGYEVDWTKDARARSFEQAADELEDLLKVPLPAPPEGEV